MDSSSLNIAVPADQQSAVAAWQDGETYTITVKQTAPGQLELVSAEADGAAEDATDTAEGASENPAMDAVMAGKKGA